MTSDEPTQAHSLEGDLLAWGKVIILETRGRHSGRPRRVAVGFIADAGGSLRIAAAQDSTHWAQNLIADPRCRVEIDGAISEHRARQLEGDDRRRTIAELILKYGTPAERQGSGPAFCLDPLDPLEPLRSP
ncbi:MAG: nitroreductase family deazaflavin-dependent oxidoreductase [Chloroflexota bacterium]